MAAPSILPEDLAQGCNLTLDLQPIESFQRETFPGAFRVAFDNFPAAQDLPQGVRLKVWVVDEARGESTVDNANPAEGKGFNRGRCGRTT